MSVVVAPRTARAQPSARTRPVSRARAAAATAGVFGGAGGLTAALGQSPVTVYVLGGLAGLTALLFCVVVLVTVFSDDERRADRALTVLSMLLATVDTPPKGCP